MKPRARLLREASSPRTRHLVFLAHVWLCVPFLVLWPYDTRAREMMGPGAAARLWPLVAGTVAYLVVRTWLAWKDPRWLRWEFVFPPIDVALVTIILAATEVGPTSNLTLLYFLPIAEAAGSLSVGWAALVGLMVVTGTGVSALASGEFGLLSTDTLAAVFKLMFLVLVSSLMAYQALLAAGLRERLGVAADRNRIALEMHDGVQGHLIGLASQLELVSRLAPSDGPRAAEVAREGRETARRAADELRFLVQRLRTPALEQGFVAALRQYAHNVCERAGLGLEFQAQEEKPMDPEVENALFRIAQESLTNVLKHAQARNVRINVAFEGEDVRLEVQDDGVGVTRIEDSGLGLVGMEERAAAVGGGVVVTPERGTKVTAIMPRRGKSG